MYAQGIFFLKDDGEAVKWMRKSADQGFAAAEFGLGAIYAHGKGVPKSESDAAEWYRKAADQDDTPAMNNLAYLLATSPDSKLRSPKGAVAIAKKATQIEPENPTYLDTLATALFANGEAAQAAESESHALKLKPDNPSYKDALAKYKAAGLN